MTPQAILLWCCVLVENTEHFNCRSAGAMAAEASLFKVHGNSCFSNNIARDKGGEDRQWIAYYVEAGFVVLMVNLESKHMLQESSSRSTEHLQELPITPRVLSSAMEPTMPTRPCALVLFEFVFCDPVVYLSLSSLAISFARIWCSMHNMT